MKKTIGRLAITTVALSIILVLTPSAAFADYDRAACSTRFGTCWTGTIISHSSQHWIKLNAWSSPHAFAEAKVYDADNGALVGSLWLVNDTDYVKGGTTTIYGLYGRYKMRLNTLWGYVSNGEICNFTNNPASGDVC